MMHGKLLGQRSAVKWSGVNFCWHPTLRQPIAAKRRWVLIYPEAYTEEVICAPGSQRFWIAPG